MKRRGMPLVLVLILAACGADQSRPAARSGDTTAGPPAAPDRLVLELDGRAVWHTLSREAVDSAGSPCLERTIEIRSDSSGPVRVPLLYTRDIPVLIDDSTLEARVYRNCLPGDRYRVNMRTGQPTPVRQP